MSESKPSKKEIAERRFNRRMFIENIFKGRKFIFNGVEVDIIDAISYASLYPGCEKLADLFDGFSEEQIRNMWIDGSLSAYKEYVRGAISSLADIHIGAEL